MIVGEPIEIRAEQEVVTSMPLVWEIKVAQSLPSLRVGARVRIVVAQTALRSFNERSATCRNLLQSVLIKCEPQLQQPLSRKRMLLFDRADVGILDVCRRRS